MIYVYFIVAKGFEQASGTFISDQEIVCETPNLEKYGPKEVEIKLKINLFDLTISSTNYKYYLNTKAENSLAFGPGLLDE